MIHRLEELLRDLEKHDWAENRKAAEALAELGQEAFPYLLSALKSEDGYVRNGAAVALGKIGNEEAAPALLQALQWRDERVYDDDEDSEARVGAAKALGALRDREACVPLIKVLGEGLARDGNLESYVVDALGEIGDKRAIPVLSGMVENFHTEIQRSARKALAKIQGESESV